MKHLPALLLVVAATSALAHAGPNESQATEARIVATAMPGSADADKTAAQRADGETAHEAGSRDESIRLLDESRLRLDI